MPSSSPALSYRPNIGPSVNTLLLWDIDCTLIDSGGAGERGLIQALKQLHNIDDDLSWLDYAGRTDFWIARAILGHHFGSTTPEDIQNYLDGYLAVLNREMATPKARILPGVETIVSAIAHHPEIAQGLLTGNIRRGAQIKLNHFGLWHHFPFGAFADDSDDRNQLGPFAHHRAEAHHGRKFPAERIFVIGDTPHDIACGKAIGAKTIAVATGRFTREALESHKPTALFTNLSDTAGILALLK